MTRHIKNPEQIAADVWHAGHSQQAESCENEIQAMIADAIRRDRAQRPVLTDAQYDVVCHAIDQVKTDDRLRDTDEYASMVCTALNPDERIIELTARWESSTGDTAENYMLSEDDWRHGLDDAEAAEIVRLLEIQKELSA